MTAKKTEAAGVAQGDNPGTTKLDDNVTEPSTNSPGDAPADTTDPSEFASSVTPNPSPEALAAGTVNAVLPIEPPAKVSDEDQDGDEFEEYEALKSDNRTKVQVRRNLRTGKSKIVSE